MGTYENFEKFCDNLEVDAHSLINTRRDTIVKRLNADFWNTESETEHNRYIGSFGRGTAIKDFHDVDLLFELPYRVYEQYNAYLFNGQSSLLQAVKNSIAKTYSTTELGADGQVVVIKFADNIRFEVLPAFSKSSGAYDHADSNNQGSWKTTNPAAEIAALNKGDVDCNGNLKRLCKMARAWRRKWDIPISGILIDTLAYNFIRQWVHRDHSYLYYDWMGRDFFEFLSKQNPTQDYWHALGSNSLIWRKGAFEKKAKECHVIATEAIASEKDYPYRTCDTWRKIYGTFYPEYPVPS